MNVLPPTLSGWFAHDDGLRARLHAAARNVFVIAASGRGFGLSPASMSATRSVRDSAATGRGSLPGESPAPSVAFPTAAGWIPALPPELRTPPPSRLTASGVFRPVTDDRQAGQDRRFQERRIRDDGSPYGVERRTGAEYRTGERRSTPEDITPTPPRPMGSGVRLPLRHEADYVPHLPDLLARFHGR